MLIVAVRFKCTFRIEAFLAKLAPEFPLSRVLRHVILERNFTLKPFIASVARERNPLVFGSHVASVIPPVAISLLALFAVVAELSSMNLHVPRQFTFIAQ